MTAHYDRALLLSQQSRFDLAEQELRHELADEPNNARAHALLALCLSGRNEYQPATREAEEAVALGPDIPFAHYALAFVLYRRDRLSEAEAAIQEALALAPWDADYYSLLASLRFAQRRWPAALEAAEQGLTFDAEHVDCLNQRALALVKLGRRAEAGTALGDALGHEPDNALTHANQGWTLLEQRQPQQALPHFREALRLEPNQEWAREGIVEALKARHWLYRQMLRYFLWMRRLSGRAQWGVILGLLFAQQALKNVFPPALAPLGTILTCCLLGFVFLTWTADPLFNLLLRLDRFGRLVLSREQIWASNLVGGCLLLALLALAWGIGSADWRFILLGLIFACLVLPVAALFQCAAGWRRTLMIVYAIFLVVLGGGGVSILFMGQYLPKDYWKDALVVSTILSGMFFLGAVGSTWLFNLLQLMRSRR